MEPEHCETATGWQSDIRREGGHPISLGTGAWVFKGSGLAVTLLFCSLKGCKHEMNAQLKATFG